MANNRVSEGEMLLGPRISSIQFSLSSPEEILNESVREVVNDEAFNTIGQPNVSGLHDLAMGPIDELDVCQTCRMLRSDCSGHYGHITLPFPVFNPFLFDYMFQLLKSCCFNCHRLLMRAERITFYHCKMRLLNAGMVSSLSTLDSFYGQLTKAIIDDDGRTDGRQVTTLNATDRLIELTENLIKTGHKSDALTGQIVLEKQRLVNEFLKEASMPVNNCYFCKKTAWILTSERKQRINISLRLRKRAAGKDAEANSVVSMTLEEEMLLNSSSIEDDSFDFSKSVVNRLKAGLRLELVSVEARAHLRALFLRHPTLLADLLSVFKPNLHRHPTDVFFIKYLPVVPNRYRPPMQMKGDFFQGEKTMAYGRVISTVVKIRNCLSKRNLAKQSTVKSNKRIDAEDRKELDRSISDLQNQVNAMYDSDLDAKRGQDPLPGLRQTLEHKNGLIRSALMGKRTNYSARTVLTPDLYIDVDELGLPFIFAQKLTIPELVNEHNFGRLKKLIERGPNDYPGAVAVRWSNGRLQYLKPDDPVQRQRIANRVLGEALNVSEGFYEQRRRNLGYYLRRTVDDNQMFLRSQYVRTAVDSRIDPRGLDDFNSYTEELHNFHPTVLRHVQNGDLVICNRQPTLHRPSMQTHRVRVLPGIHTFRLHYSTCKSYNADFDGDEMNVHLPQSLLAQVEAATLSCVPEQYVSPKDGSPLGGLIQDHIVAAVYLTMPDKFLTRSQYQQLVLLGIGNAGRCGQIRLLRPAIVKPCPLWTGKQVVSTLLLNLLPYEDYVRNAGPTLSFTSKLDLKTLEPMTANRTAPNRFGGTALKGNEMTECQVIWRQGQLMTGVLDKAIYGKFGLVHSCHELYGSRISANILSAFGRLFTSYMQWTHGFTVGIEDVEVRRKADKIRAKLARQTLNSGADIIAETFSLPKDTPDFERLASEKIHESYSGDESKSVRLDQAYKCHLSSVMNDCTKAVIPHGLLVPFPHNRFLMMIQSGAKGSIVNVTQMSSMFGQIEIAGRRVAPHIGGRTLPSWTWARPFVR